MNRFFTTRREGDEVFIEGGDAKHLAKVLRMKIGDSVECVCEGKVYRAEILSLSLLLVRLRLCEKLSDGNEPKTEIHLFQGIVKGNKWDYLLQKNTEVGVHSFHPVQMARSVAKLEGQQKLQRFQSIVEEAAKQSKRDRIPSVFPGSSFEEMCLKLSGFSRVLVPYEEEREFSLKRALTLRPLGENSKVAVIIGPEGGFEETEIRRLKEFGAETVSLGNRILRTETAGLLTAALILYETGDLE